MRRWQSYNNSWQHCLITLPMGLRWMLKAGLSLHLQCPATALSNEFTNNAAYSYQPVAGMCYINYLQPFEWDAPLKATVWKQSLRLRDVFGFGIFLNKHTFTLKLSLWVLVPRTKETKNYLIRNSLRCWESRWWNSHGQKMWNLLHLHRDQDLPLPVTSLASPTLLSLALRMPCLVPQQAGTGVLNTGKDFLLKTEEFQSWAFALLSSRKSRFGDVFATGVGHIGHGQCKWGGGVAYTPRTVLHSSSHGMWAGPFNVCLQHQSSANQIITVAWPRTSGTRWHKGPLRLSSLSPALTNP